MHPQHLDSEGTQSAQGRRARMCRWLIAGALVALVGCQKGAPAAKDAGQSKPTAAEDTTQSAAAAAEDTTQSVAAAAEDTTQSAAAAAEDPMGLALRAHACQKAGGGTCADPQLDPQKNAEWQALFTTLYVKPCEEENDGLACRHLALMYALEEQIPNGPTLAVQYFERSCEGGHADACISLGAMYAQGLGATQDRERARELFRGACRDGNSAACAQLGTSRDLAAGAPEGIGPMTRRLYSFCYAGSEGACAKWQSSGLPLPFKEKDFFAPIRDACDAGELAACGQLGLLYAQGTGVEPSMPKALEILRRACDAGEQSACTKLGLTMTNGGESQRDQEEIFKILSGACAAKEQNACIVVASMHLIGQGTQQNVSKAFSLFREGCAANRVEACRALGHLYAHSSDSGVEADPAQAKIFFKKACDLGEMQSCLVLERGQLDDSED